MKKLLVILLALATVLASFACCFAAVSSVEKIDELDGKKIAVQTAVAYEDAVKDRIPKATWDYYTTPNDMILALESNKIDAYLIEEVGFAAQHYSHKELRRLDEAAGSIGFAITIGKGDNQNRLLLEVNKFIEESKASGLSKEMYDYWVTNWNPEECFYAIPDYDPKAEELRVAVEGAYEPFSFEVDGSLTGFDVEFVCRFCKEYGYRPVFEPIPFDQISPATENGKYNFGMNIVATDERTESSVLSEDYYSCDIVFVVEDVYDDGIGLLEKIGISFDKTFIKENRWKMFVEGTGVTILITLASLLFGTLLGFLVYLACRHGNKFLNGVAGFFNWLIEGMPTVVLLMILFYVIFGSSKLSGTWISIIGFTLIFACCMFDMLCVGCGAISKGQIEASRALGYTDRESFFKIILPQAARHFLPIYKNDMVSLIKETSIVGYIAVRDLTKISDFVRSRTYEAFFALIATAIIYFVVEGVLSFVISRIQIKIDPKRRSKDKILDGIKQWD